MKTISTTSFKRRNVSLFVVGLLFTIHFNLNAQNLDPLWAIWKFEHGMDFEEYVNSSGKINYYVTWASASSAGWDHEIYSKTVSFNTNGNLQVLVNDHVAIGGWEAQEPVASTMNPANNYILSVFEDGGQSNIPDEAVNISAQLHTPDGTVIKSYFQIADGPGAQHSPAAGHIGNRFLAFYGEDYNVSSTQMKVAVLDDVTGNLTQTIAITPANEYHWWGVYASNSAEDVGLAAWVKDTELVAGSIITESGGVVSATPYQVYLTGAEFVYNRVIWLENINRFALITKAVNGQGAASDVTFIALIDENGNKTQEAQIQGGIIQEGEPAAQWDPNTQSYIFVYPTGTNDLKIVKINNSEITYHSTIIGNNNTFLNGITWKNTGIMSKFIKDENGNQVWNNQYIALFAMGNFDTHNAHLLPIRIDTDIFGSSAQTPYGGVAWAVPGKIEAEDYDNGGEGIAYHDLTAGNAGSIYRTDDVDMEVCSDTGGGYNIGATEDSEWLEYTINVAGSGIYSISARVATAWGGTKFKILSDGIDLTGVVDVPNTGGWQTWQTISSSSVYLSAGQQVLQFEVVSGGFNLNNIEIIASGLVVKNNLGIPYPSTPVESYGGSQDKGPEATVLNNGNEVQITGNSWKKINFTYTVTANTVLEFDYKSTSQGEIHGIGFDNNLGISSNKTFRLYGVQNWGIGTFDNYSGTAWKSYKITVGDFYTGNMNYLFFVNDHDVANPSANGSFRNIKVYEENTTNGGRLATNETIQNNLSVEEKPEFDIQIYPNPAQNKFYVNTGISSGANHIKVYNLMGELILETQLKDGGAIDISSYKTGIYLVNVNNSITKRLVKE